MARTGAVSSGPAAALQLPSSLHHMLCCCCRCSATAGQCCCLCRRTGRNRRTAAAFCCNCGETVASVSFSRPSPVRMAFSFAVGCVLDRAAAAAACPSALTQSRLQILGQQQEKRPYHEQQQEDGPKEQEQAERQHQPDSRLRWAAPAATKTLVARGRRKNPAPSTSAALLQSRGEQTAAGALPVSEGGWLRQEGAESTGPAAAAVPAAVAAQIATAEASAEEAADVTVHVIVATEAGASGAAGEVPAARRRREAAKNGGEIASAALYASVRSGCESSTNKICVFFPCEGLDVEAAVPAAGDLGGSVTAAAAAARQGDRDRRQGTAAEAAPTVAAAAARRAAHTVVAAAAARTALPSDRAAAADVVVQVSATVQAAGATAGAAALAEKTLVPAAEATPAARVITGAAATPTGGRGSETAASTAAGATAAAPVRRGGGGADKPGKTAAETEVFSEENTAAEDATARHTNERRMHAVAETAAGAVQAVLPGVSPSRLLVATKSSVPGQQQCPPQRQQTEEQQLRVKPQPQQQKQGVVGTLWAERSLKHPWQQQQLQDEQLQHIQERKQQQRQRKQQQGLPQQRQGTEEGRCNASGVLCGPLWRAAASATAAGDGPPLAVADLAALPLRGVDAPAGATLNAAVSRFSSILPGCSRDLHPSSSPPFSSCSVSSGSPSFPSFSARPLVGQLRAAAAVRSSTRSGALLLLLPLLLHVRLSSFRTTPLSAAVADTSRTATNSGSSPFPRRCDAPAAAAGTSSHLPAFRPARSHPCFFPSSFPFVVGAEAAATSRPPFSPVQPSPVPGRTNNGVAAGRLAAAAATAAIGGLPVTTDNAAAAGGAWTDVEDDDPPACGGLTRLVFECLHTVFYAVLCVSALLHSVLSLVALLILLVFVSTSFYAALLLSPLLLLRPFLRLSLHVTAQAAYYLVAGCCACIAACLTVAVFSTLQQLLL